MEEERKLAEVKEKLAQQVQKMAKPAEEVEVSVSKTSVSLPSLGQEDAATTKPKECCSGTKYCFEEDTDTAALSQKCIKCNGLAQTPCVRNIVGSLFICYKCYWGGMAEEGT